MSQKYFPIRTETACQLKWNWSTLYLYGGRTASCHRTGWGEVTPDTFDSFHNTDKKIRERQQMLEGKWPDESCEYCRRIEENGGFSDRMLHLDIPNMVPTELLANPTATVVSPTILEVFFNNVCNLGCLYCLPMDSSRINQEHIKFGDFNRNGVELKSETIDPNYNQVLEKFWQWMNKNSKTLKRFNVLGGEPFYQEEFYRLIDFVESTPHPDLELGIVTNLMINEDKLTNLINRFKELLTERHLKRIDITCSIDCWGPEQEYVRYGLDLATWQKNFELLITHKWLTVNINQTVSLLSIKTMPKLIQLLTEWRKQTSIGHYFSVVNPQPSYLRLEVLGSEVFRDDFTRILDLLPTETKSQRQAKMYMEGIFKVTENSVPDPIEMLKLKTFLDEKDRRRGTNWRQVFPWLELELKNVV